MKNQKRFTLLFTVMVLSSLVSAHGAIRMGGNGFRLQMVPIDPGGNSSSRTAVADCRVRVNQRDVLLHWSATPFTHVDDSQVVSDSFLATTVTEGIRGKSVLSQDERLIGRM